MYIVFSARVERALCYLNILYRPSRELQLARGLDFQPIAALPDIEAQISYQVSFAESPCSHAACPRPLEVIASAVGVNVQKLCPSRKDAERTTALKRFGVYAGGLDAAGRGLSMVKILNAAQLDAKIAAGSGYRGELRAVRALQAESARNTGVFNYHSAESVVPNSRLSASSAHKLGFAFILARSLASISSFPDRSMCTFPLPV